MTTRRTIAADPFDAVIPAQGAPAATKPRSRKTVRTTLHISEELYDQMRDAVVALSGPPHRMTLVTFVEGAMRRELERLQQDENDGEPFPPRGGEVRRGRPIRA